MSENLYKVYGMYNIQTLQAKTTKRDKLGRYTVHNSKIEYTAALVETVTFGHIHVKTFV